VLLRGGPTGFGLHRGLEKSGVDYMVVAPSLVPARSGDRVKTDRREAMRLARFLRSGDLTAVHLPQGDRGNAGPRAGPRGRQARGASARRQLGKSLLLHDRRSPVKTAWSKKHLDWIRVQRFEHAAQQRVIDDYLKSVDDLRERLDEWRGGGASAPGALAACPQYGP